MDCDVVVAGAGPVGLLLAAELRLAGARVPVMERDRDPVRPVRTGAMGARALNTPTVAALHLRGLLPAVRAAALAWFDGTPDALPESPTPSAADTGNAVFTPAFAGHFAGIGIRLDRIDPSDPELAESALGGGVIAQQDLEDVLGERARELGAEVRRGIALTAYAQDPDGVSVDAGGEHIRTGWLVGCDGGRSTVRALGGFAFPGADPVFTGRQAVVEMTGAEGLVAGGWQHGVAGSYVLGGWADGEAPRIHTVEFVPPGDRHAAITAGELEESIRRVSGVDVTVTAVHAATRYADTTRQADTYRHGRVLLAGDAAHVHSPAGGQGLNLGLGDAMNLGWKLGAVARGSAPETLLDSYTAERHPIGAWVQDWSMAQTALSRGHDPRAQALRGVLADLLDTPGGATYVLKKISGGWQRYDLPGHHPLIGRRAPDLALDDGTTLAEHSRDGRAILLDGLGVADRLRVSARWGDRLTVCTARPTQFRETPFAALVRPDGHIAWIATAPADDGLVPALETWLGP